MATFRVGVGSFNINDGSVGIGTEGSGHGNLKVEGTIKSTNLDVLGVSTFTRYSGFSADENKIGNRDLNLSGEFQTVGDVVIETDGSLTVSSGSTACVAAPESLTIANHFSLPSGDTAQRNEVSGYTEGSIRYNTDLGTVEFFNGNEWRQFRYQSDIQRSPSTRGRGILAGGYDPIAGSSTQDNISFVNIVTEGNSLDFGNLITGRTVRAASSETRAVLACGFVSPTGSNIIEYITVPSEGNGIDFGDATIQRRNYAILSNSTRAVMCGGESPALTNVMDYVEIATTGNALDFGDMTGENDNGEKSGCGGMASPTRGIIHGDQVNNQNAEFITIASKGNSSFFGDLDDKRRNCGSCSNGIRGVIAGGYNNAQRVSLVSFITIASEGNFTAFGDLSNSTDSGFGMCNPIRAIFTGGYPDHSKPLETINFASGGNAVHFGFDLWERGQNAGYCSDSHGGLGGY